MCNNFFLYNCLSPSEFYLLMRHGERNRAKDSSTKDSKVGSEVRWGGGGVRLAGRRACNLFPLASARGWYTARWTPSSLGWLVGWVSGLGRRRVENFEEIGAAVYKSAFIGRGEARNTELPWMGGEIIFTDRRILFEFLGFVEFPPHSVHIYLLVRETW